MKHFIIFPFFIAMASSSYAQWTGQTSAGDLSTPISRTGMISIDGYNGAQIRLNSQGTYFGKIGNPSPQVWSLGWGATGSDINSVLNWTAGGHVGVGTASPIAKLDVGVFIPGGILGTVFGRLQEGNTVNEGTYLGVRGYGTQVTDYAGKGFAIEHSFYGQTNSSINFYRGGNTTGGFITFNTNANSEKMRITPSGDVGIGTVSPMTRLDLGELRFGALSTFPSEGSIPEGTWGNYVVGDVNSSQRLKLGVSNDGYTRAEIFMDNSNRQDGTLSFKTANASGGVQTRMFINGNGDIGIGTSSPDQKLTVNGTIHSKQVKIDLTVPGPDYVFEKDYPLPSLEQIKSYIDQNKHLPEVPSAKEMEANGVNVGEMNMLLLKKVEELTLYVIEANKRMDAQQMRIDKQEKEIEKLKLK